jgi:hypothetical protein
MGKGYIMTLCDDVTGKPILKHTQVTLLGSNEVGELYSSHQPHRIGDLGRAYIKIRGGAVVCVSPIAIGASFIEEAGDNERCES